MSLFLNSRSELRTGWKLAAFVVMLIPVWLAAGIMLQVLATVLVGELNDFQATALNVLISVFPAVITTLFATRVLEHLPLQAFGIGFHAGWLSIAGTGMAIASVLLFLQLLGAILFGQTTFEWTAMHRSPGSFLLTLGMLALAAVFEELIFRGYPLQVLMKGIGVWPAIAVMSCIFGLLHAGNPDSSPLGVFNTIVAGMMLSLAYLKTRSLWFPYGLHLGWNVATGMIAGVPVSGLNLPSLWTTHVRGPAWLLGGNYGPEGGALGTLIFLAGAVAVWKVRIRHNNDDRFYKDARAG